MREQGGMEIKQGKIFLSPEARARYEREESKTLRAVHSRAARLCHYFGVPSVEVVSVRGAPLGEYTLPTDGRERHGQFSWYSEHGISVICWGSYRASVDGADVVIERGSKVVWQGSVGSSIDPSSALDREEAKAFVEGYLRALAPRELRRFIEMSGRGVSGSFVMGGPL
jgi:hypothetical protein